MMTTVGGWFDKHDCVTPRPRAVAHQGRNGWCGRVGIKFGGCRARVPQVRPTPGTAGLAGGSRGPSRARALHVVRTDFLLFDEQRTARTVEALTQRLRESANGVQSSQICDDSAAVFTTLIALVVSFIGEDLATRLLRDVWPELPMPEPTSQSSNGHVEANL